MRAWWSEYGLTVGVVIGVLAICVAISAACAWVVWQAWLWIGVGVFHWPVLSYEQVWMGTFVLGLLGRMIFPSASSSECKK